MIDPLSAPKLLELAGLALYGEHWRGPMSQLLKVRRNTVDGWMTERTDVPAGVWSEIATALIDQRKSLDQVLQTFGASFGDLRPELRDALAERLKR